MLGKVNVYQPLKINQIAPNQRDAKWDMIKNVKSPFGDPPAKEFGFWFNYFWAEAIELPGITQAQKVKLSETFFSIFEGAPGAYKVRTDFATRTNEFKENALRQLLLIGFKRVALEPPRLTHRPKVGGKSLAPAPLQAVDASLLNLTMLLTGSGEQWPIAYRSDARSYDELLQHFGFRPRARSYGAQIFTDFAMDQPWHPFSNNVYRNSLFLRLGSTNKDNCLQTVISVGPKFAEITHFPILNDYVLVFQAKSADGRYLAVKPLDEWTPEDINLALTHRQKVRVVKDSGGVIDHAEKDNHIHVFHLKGIKGYNTEAHFSGADKFPERGMEKVPVEHLLADIHFVQKWWYNEKTGNLKLYELAFSPIRWVPNEQTVNKLIGMDGKARLETFLQGEIQRARQRREIVDEGVLYNQFQREKATRLSAEERKNLIAALKEFHKGGGKQLMKPEKDAMKLKFSSLVAKIDAVSPLQWSELRAASKA